jgi:hypothetical protein
MSAFAVAGLAVGLTVAASPPPLLPPPQAAAETAMVAVIKAVVSVRIHRT